MNQISMTSNQSVDFSRTLIMFKSLKNFTDSLNEFMKILNKSNQADIRGIIVGDDLLFTDSSFKPIMKHLTSFQDIKKVKLNQVSNFLGQTADFVVMDLRKEFNPNKLIILVETVRGGGLVLLLGDEENKWIHSVNKDHFTHTEGSKLLKWFLMNTKNRKNCILQEQEKLNLWDYYNPMPEKLCLSEEILGIPLTPGQKNLMENLSKEWGETPLSDIIDVIIADRGRGKSAVIGLTLAHVLSRLNKVKRRIIVTANDISHVQTLFQFLAYGLSEYEVNHQVQKKKTDIVRVIIPKGSKIEYRWPNELSKSTKTHFLIVDEAAAFPQDLLNDLIRSDMKTVLISTIHGYEGAGRSFQYKILNQIDRLSNKQYQIHKLEEPIRYPPNDSLESLINDTFLLEIEKTEHDEIKIVPQKNQLDFHVLSEPSLLLNPEKIDILKEIYGLLVHAHYRNQPNDLLLLADSGNHFLITLNGKNSVNDQPVLLACQLAREGSLSRDKIKSVMKGEFLEGNLIPTVGIRHFSPDFANLSGLRIVRLASQPDLVNKGLGKTAVNRIIEEFHSYDWIGVSFGATSKLIKFWRKLGFVALHVRPIRTAQTGEWNIVFVKPNSINASELVNQASRDFFLQFIHLLKQSLFELKPEICLEIIRSMVNIPNYEMRITDSGLYRLRKYIEGNLNFLLVVDVLYEIVIAYFAIPMKIQLSPGQEKLLIARILQGRTWGQTLGKTGLTWKEANALLKKSIEKIVNHIGGN